MVVVHDVFAAPASEDAPVMLERLEQIDLIALDAAVSADRMGERARRLLANRQHMAPERLPRLLMYAAGCGVTALMFLLVVTGRLVFREEKNRLSP